MQVPCDFNGNDIKTGFREDDTAKQVRGHKHPCISRVPHDAENFPTLREYGVEVSRKQSNILKVPA